MTGRHGDGPQGYERHDWYADYRCICGHIVYANDTPGEPCQFCACQSHTAPAAPIAGAA